MPIVFITLMGVVSLFSDMTHEGARSILGPFMSTVGASAAVIATVSGAGELCGYSLRLLSGFVADKTHKYWTLVILGYALQVAAVPALALVGRDGWAAACALLILERVAKAVKKPAKNTLVSFAASRIGVGKGFAYQEALDQLGAFAGPVMLFFLAKIRGGGAFETYRLCFAALAIPAAITIAFTLIARAKFPHPEVFEADGAAKSPPPPLPSQQGERSETHEGKTYGGNPRFPPSFWLYMVTVSLFAFGFADFPLLSLHASRTGAFTAANITLLYALAMLTDALSALVFGALFDRIGQLSLGISTLIASAFAPLVFLCRTPACTIIGCALWGVGMGAEESVMKACVASATSREMRSRGFGVAETLFGAAWFAGSILLGVLYDKSRPLLCALSMASLAASALCAAALWKKCSPPPRGAKPTHNKAR